MRKIDSLEKFLSIINNVNSDVIYNKVDIIDLLYKNIDVIDNEGVLQIVNENPASDKSIYQRIELNNNFCSVYAMVWFPGVGSAIHEHKNFKGVVKVIHGKLTERNFNEVNGQLTFVNKAVLNAGEKVIEKKDSIHDLRNNSITESAVTLHVYYPRTLNLEGTRIFNFEDKKIGILKSTAKATSWNLAAEHFERIYSY